ncbi:MAG: PPOX class F420-dependent oxidoreductase [Mycobacterium sp.]
MSFKTHEIEYLKAADLGRLATIAPDGSLQNSPVGFSYNDELGTIDISGYGMSKSRKYRNIESNSTVAFVVDDIFSRDPWRVRCLEIRGTAESAEAEPTTEANGASDDDAGRGTSPAEESDHQLQELDTAIIRITPHRIISFGIDDTETEPHLLKADSRDVPTTGS